MWDEFLDTCVYAYNTSVHESSGFSPFELMFGRKALLPIDIDSCEKDPKCLLDHLDEEANSEVVEYLTTVRLEKLNQAQENIKKAQIKQKEHYDKKYAHPNGFLVGDKVLKKDFRKKKRAGGKLDAQYIGPFNITKLLGKGYYSLEGVANPQEVVERVSGAYLKPYKGALVSAVIQRTITSCKCIKEIFSFLKLTTFPFSRLLVNNSTQSAVVHHSNSLSHSDYDASVSLSSIV